MSDATDKVRDEFFSEAQEIIETLSRNLLALDAAQKAGATDPSLINEAFRAVHTLKGLAGLFGAARMGALSHRLEDVLDDLRLGRMDLDPVALDALFRSIDVFGAVLTAERKEDDAPLPAVDELLERLDQLGAAARRGQAPSSEYDLDPGLLAVLTEYEEHRLHANIEAGFALYRLRVQFELVSIDRALEEMKERAKRHGEIITYLPTGEAASADSIELDLLLASKRDLAALIGALGGDNVVIEPIPRRARSGGAHRPSVAPAGAAGRAQELASIPAAVEPVPAPSDPTLRSVTQTVRVDIRKLDSLMNTVGELAMVRSALHRVFERVRREGQRPLAAELQRLHRTFERRLAELQDGILEVRMVPLGQVFDRLARVVRQIGRELGKEIRLVITGAETEIDKLIVEELSDPLMHMIRNAIDHGIEAAERRASVGKPAVGTIALNAYQKGNHVMIEVEDDGRGIDEEALVSRAVSRGIVQAAEVPQLARSEILALIFVPGFSTRNEASDVSGRGFGMDIVKTNIAKLGGVIDIQSEPGIGTKLTITLPITLAIVSALLVRVADHVYALPLATVSEAIAFDPAGVRVVDRREVMTLRGATLQLCRLDRLFGLGARPGEAGGAPRRFVVVVNVGARRLGLIVDHLFGQQDIVIKALGASLASVKGFAGATELGDQRVGLVLDAASLIEEVLASHDAHRPEASLHG
ncbi:MAG: chemotaxis protein CheA [Polyangiaceae bacterium]|nr:chemotaxis protein CheA [Polyangiaceae bacterium]